MFSLRNVFALAALIASVLPPSHAHTWIEEYQVIGENGSYIGDRGFSRGYVARTDPTFDGDATILWLLPQDTAVMPNGAVRLRINATDSLCHPSQRTSNYTNPEYPMLKAAPGNYVAMKYLENGHVTLPWNQVGKPAEGGTVYVFGTNQPSNDEKIVDVMKWNRQGTGGDGRGWLMSTQNFDDGRCHQINDCVLSVGRQAVFPNTIPGQNVSVEQWCESDLQIPQNVKPGKLTTYWVWQWPTQPEKDCTYPDGKDEYYTTCADFEIIADSPGNARIVEEVATNTLLQENFQTRAVETYKARTARTTDPVLVEDWNVRVATSAKINPTWSSSCSSVMMAEQSAIAAGSVPQPPPSCPAGKWATGTLSAIVAESALAAARTSHPAIATTTPPPASEPATSPGGPTASAPRHPHKPHKTYKPHKPHAAGGMRTVTSTTYYTETVTVKAVGSAPSPPSAAQNAGATPQAFSVVGELSTISTVNASPSETAQVELAAATSGCGVAPAASTVTVYAAGLGPSGAVREHVERHARRGHARQFV